MRGWAWFCPIVAHEEIDIGWQAASVDAALVANAAPLCYAFGKPNPRRLSESQRPWPMMR